MDERPTHLDLFSGLGGFALAARDAGFRTVAFCEFDQRCRNFLEAAWGLPIYPDIKELIQALTGMSAIEYCTAHGFSTTNEIRGSADNVCQGSFDWADRGILSGDEAGDVGHFENKGSELQAQHSSGQGESFFSRDESLGSSAEYLRTGTGKGHPETTGKVLDVSITGKNPGASSGLQQTAGCYVAVPTVPSPMAQNKSSDTADQEASDHDAKGNFVAGRDSVLQIALEKITNGRLDLLTAGTPCQGASVAGKRGGTQDDRFLWPETIAAIAVLKPKSFLLENVPGLITLNDGVEFDGILSDLERIGYSCQTFDIPACAVDSPQLRHRIWIVGFLADSAISGREGRDSERATDGCGSECSQSDDMGDAQCECEQRGPVPTGGPARTLRGVARPTASIWDNFVWVPCADGKIRRAPDDSFLLADGLYPEISECLGSAHRSLLGALGNSIVPQVAYEILKVIRCEILN